MPSHSKARQLRRGRRVRSARSLEGRGQPGQNSVLDLNTVRGDELTSVILACVSSALLKHVSRRPCTYHHVVSVDQHSHSLSKTLFVVCVQVGAGPLLHSAIHTRRDTQRQRYRHASRRQIPIFQRSCRLQHRTWGLRVTVVSSPAIRKQIRTSARTVTACDKDSSILLWFKLGQSLCVTETVLHFVVLQELFANRIFGELFARCFV
jgi:hypothetical protein